MLSTADVSGREQNPVARFLAVKAVSLAGRARRMAALTPEGVGLRAQDRPYAPSPEHFAAATKRLQQIDKTVALRLKQLASLNPSSPSDDVILAMAMVEREIDRARRAFGMFFEVFAQRGTSYGPSLVAHDIIARDCYAAVQAAAPTIFPGPVVPPLTYLEQGYSPATMRRGVALNRLLGESNPFPLIRIPYDRDHPWQAVFLHEIAHNLQADLGLWVENKNVVIQRLEEGSFAPLAISVIGRWHKEIFADLAALLLGGPATAWGMAEFLAHPADKVMTYRPGGAHPTSYLRVPIMAEMLRRMGFEQDGATLRAVWKRLYDPRRGHRIPAILLKEGLRAIPSIVDEIAYQPRRALAERALASVIPFSRDQQAQIRRAGLLLAQGRIPASLPPRHLVSAARYAIEAGARPAALNKLILACLTPERAPSAGRSAQIKVA